MPTSYKPKNYVLDKMPEIDDPENEIKIMTAILYSLKEKKLLNQQQINDCIDRLRKIHQKTTAGANHLGNNYKLGVFYDR